MTRGLRRWFTEASGLEEFCRAQGQPAAVDIRAYKSARLLRDRAREDGQTAVASMTLDDILGVLKDTAARKAEEYRQSIEAAERSLDDESFPEDRKAAIRSLLGAIKDIDALEAEAGGPISF